HPAARGRPSFCSQRGKESVATLPETCHQLPPHPRPSRCLLPGYASAEGEGGPGRGRSLPAAAPLNGAEFRSALVLPPPPLLQPLEPAGSRMGIAPSAELSRRRTRCCLPLRVPAASPASGGTAPCH
ncbi:hypothetical protein KIL84_002631, partial [Mauremys mutica]